MLLLIEHLQLRGVHFAKCGAQLAAIKVLLDLAKLDRTRDLGRVTTDDAGGYPVFGALVRFKAIAASDQDQIAAGQVYRRQHLPIPRINRCHERGDDIFVHRQAVTLDKNIPRIDLFGLAPCHRVRNTNSEVSHRRPLRRLGSARLTVAAGSPSRFAAASPIFSASRLQRLGVEASGTGRSASHSSTSTTVQTCVADPNQRPFGKPCLSIRMRRAQWLATMPAAFRSANLMKVGSGLGGPRWGGH